MHGLSIHTVNATQKAPLPVEFLKEFYTVYNNAWTQGLAPLQLKKRLKQLQTRYCSKRFQKEIGTTEGYDLDHDVLIADFYATNEELKTLLVKPISEKGRYLVSYNVMVDNFGTKENVLVKITVKVIQENGAFKIDGAK